MTFQNGLTGRTKMLDAIKKREVSDLTKDEIIVALREEGITDFETLTTRLHETIRERAGRQPQRARASDWRAFSKPLSGEAASKIVHRVPHVPLVIDGVQHEPEEIRKFNGRPLDFVLTGTATNDPLLMAFTEFGPIAAYLQARWVESQLGFMHHVPKWCWAADKDYRLYQYLCGTEPHPPAPQPDQSKKSCSVTYATDGGTVTYSYPCGTPPPPPPPPSLIARFYEHFHQNQGGGNSIWLSSNYLHSDLTNVYLGGVWPFDSNWNDKISAVSLNGATVLCAEHTNFEGSRLLLTPWNWTGRYIDLTPLGWNDRISSMWNFGAI